VDCNATYFTENHFTDNLVTDSGPYETEEEALEAGLNAAGDWCVDNNVVPDEPD
jgi:hypothetical protein